MKTITTYDPQSHLCPVVWSIWSANTKIKNPGQFCIRITVFHFNLCQNQGVYATVIRGQGEDSLSHWVITQVFQIVLTIEPTLIVLLWALSPILFEVWTFLTSTSLVKHHSNVGVQLRRVATWGPHTLIVWGMVHAMTWFQCPMASLDLCCVRVVPACWTHPYRLNVLDHPHKIPPQPTRLSILEVWNGTYVDAHAPTPFHGSKMYTRPVWPHAIATCCACTCIWIVFPGFLHTGYPT